MALAAPRTSNPARAPRGGRPSSAGRPLAVVEGRRGRSPRPRRHLVVLALLLSVGSLVAVAGAHAYLTQGQFKLTRLQDQLSAQLGEHRDLELKVAQLEQPSNVLSEAQKQGLVVPSSVTDLPQVATSAPATTTEPATTSQAAATTSKPAKGASSTSAAGASDNARSGSHGGTRPTGVRG